VSHEPVNLRCKSAVQWVLDTPLFVLHSLCAPSSTVASLVTLGTRDGQTARSHRRGEARHGDCRWRAVRFGAQRIRDPA